MRIVVGAVLACAALLAGTTGAARASSPPHAATLAATAASAQLEGVSCVARDRCVAVGWYAIAGNNDHTFAAALDGTTWTVQPTPNPTGNDELHAVSCASTTSCVAVGNQLSETSTLVLALRQGRWHVVASPSPGGANNDLYGVSCPTPTSCAAVGWDETALPGVPVVALALVLRAGRWSAVHAASPSRQQVSQLFAVACRRTSPCVAVGGGQPATLVEQASVHGFVPLSSQSPGRSSALAAVACAARGGCVAVGSEDRTSGTASTALVEEPSHGRWRVRAVSWPGRSSELGGVACPSATACVAVGDDAATASGPTATLVASGPAFTRLVSPDPGAGGDELAAVSCPTTRFCLAVGWQAASVGGATAPLVLVGRPGGTFAVATAPGT